jgi:hypothetical protein
MTNDSPEFVGMEHSSIRNTLLHHASSPRVYLLSGGEEYAHLFSSNTCPWQKHTVLNRWILPVPSTSPSVLSTYVSQAKATSCDIPKSIRPFHGFDEIE